jgi:hypothetical protein
MRKEATSKADNGSAVCLYDLLVRGRVTEFEIELNRRRAGGAMVSLPPDRDFAWQIDGAPRGRSAVNARAVEDIPQFAGCAAQGDADGVIQRRDILCSQVFLVIRIFMLYFCCLYLRESWVLKGLSLRQVLIKSTQFIFQLCCVGVKCGFVQKLKAILVKSATHIWSGSLLKRACW